MEHKVNITFKTQILDKNKQTENFYKTYIFSQRSVMALSFSSLVKVYQESRFCRMIIIIKSYIIYNEYSKNKIILISVPLFQIQSSEKQLQMNKGA